MPSFHTPYCLEVSGGKVGLRVYVKNHLPSFQLKKYTLPNKVATDTGKNRKILENTQILFEFNWKRV